MKKEDIQKELDEVSLEMRGLLDAVKDTSKEVNLDEIRSKKAELEARRLELEKQYAECDRPEDNDDVDTRSADNFVKTGKMEIRAVLASGQIATPRAAGGVNGLGEVADSIVDDVNVFELSGNGAWRAAYKKTEAAAADVTDGSTIGGTASTYDYVDISPAEWGILDEVSKQVKKMTPVAYEAAVKDSALIALRTKAADTIVTNVLASSLAKAVTVALDADFVRTLVLGYRSIAGKGAVKLYLSQTDLATLGAIRGTNEKKAVYEIVFDEGTTTSGIIKDGGTAVAFRVLDQLSAGTQLFGQPLTIDMPMWGGMEVSTDEGGEYFAKNVIGVKGLQTANADLAAKYGMQVVTQSE